MGTSTQRKKLLEIERDDNTKLLSATWHYKTDETLIDNEIRVGFSGLTCKNDVISIAANHNSEIMSCIVAVAIEDYRFDDPKFTYKSSDKRIKIYDDWIVIPKDYTGTSVISITASETGYYRKTTRNIVLKVGVSANKITAGNFTKKASPKAQSFNIGASCKGGATLTYASNNSSVKVSSAGKVTIAKNFTGTATITITAKAKGIYEKTTKKITVTVNPIANTITAKNLTKGAAAKAKTYALGATCLGGAKLSYSSDNSKITVDASGNVTVAKNYVGKATITITAAAKGIYKKTTQTVTFTVKQNANTITMKTTAASASASAQKITLGASAYGGAKLTYKSSNSKLPVSSSGVITVPKNYAGTTKITVTAAATTAYKAATATFTFTVNKIGNTITASNLTVDAAEEDYQVSLPVSALGGAALSYAFSTGGFSLTDGQLTIPGGFTGTAIVTVTAAAKGIYTKTTKKLIVTVNPTENPIEVEGFDEVK